MQAFPRGYMLKLLLWRTGSEQQALEVSGPVGRSPEMQLSPQRRPVRSAPSAFARL